MKPAFAREAISSVYCRCGPESAASELPSKPV
jgi:hypothetical protein